MPFDPQALSHLKGIAVALLGVIAAALGILAVGSFGDYFEANPFYTSIAITASLGIDLLGALIPIVAALVSMMVFFKSARSPIRKFAVAFSVSVVLAFLLCHTTTDGIAGYPLLFALAASVVAAGVNVYPKPFINLRRNLIDSLSLTITCIPLAMFIVDITYSPYFPSATIGGNGLTDSLLLSTLYAPLAITVVFSAIAYVSQTVLLAKKSHAISKTPIPTGIKPLISENTE